MSKYKTYPTYKDAEIQWLGEIPLHWKEIKTKFLFAERVEKGHPNETLLAATQTQGVISKDKYETRTVTAQKDFHLLKLVKKGDFVISLRSFQGGIEIAHEQGIISPAYTIMEGEATVFNGYFKHVFKSNNFISGLTTFVTGIREGQNIDYSKFRMSYLPLPPLSEQTAIANFLDRKTREIDGFITFKEKTIALLKERKTAIINKAVTKGLEDTAPMKDSGYEWLGKIPAHWLVKRLRYLGKCQNGVSNGADYFGSGYPFVNYGDAYKNRVLPNDVSGLAKATKRDRELYSVKRGDVFFTRTSETIEEIGFASTCVKTIDDASFSGFLIRFRPMKNCLDTSFSKYYFRSNLHRPYFTKEMNLVIRASLSQDLLKGLPVILPSLSEQKLIGDYLDQQIAKLDLSIAQAEKEISLIKEYQQNLISEAVTGKIDVRDEIKVDMPLNLAAEGEVAYKAITQR